MSDPTEYYAVIAQVAATFAGFGSLASGIGKRRGGDDARMDAYRLRSMLSASLSATLLSLLPITLGALLGDDTAGVHAAALVGSGAILVFTPASMLSRLAPAPRRRLQPRRHPDQSHLRLGCLCRFRTLPGARTRRA
jgi:hypothetical protein